MKTRYTIKQILTSNGHWWNFYQKHKDRIRENIVVVMVKLLSCRSIIRGRQEYHCPHCQQVKYVFFSCKSRACSSCGKKATDLWIQKQHTILPATSWQHMTFTMPDDLWDFFWYNRYLLNEISKMAANCVQTIAKHKGVLPGIFIALHTFGRNLKRNVHIHLSTTLGGLLLNGLGWKKIYFDQATLMRLWRYQIITLLRQAYKENRLVIPKNIQAQLNHTFTFSHFLNGQFKKYWIVHCGKPSSNHKHNVNYLGRYIKRPPIAESKLRHYDGNSVTFRYLDHHTKTYQNFTATAEEFIARLIQHIPDKNFRLIRYYGFLAHRVRSKLLPIVHSLLGLPLTQAPKKPTYADMIQQNFGINPLVCVLCGAPLVLTSVYFGLTNINQLLQFHRQLALMKKIP